MFKTSIKKSLLFLLLIPLLITSIVFATYSISVDKSRLEGQLVSRGNSMLQSLSIFSEYLISTKNLHLLHKILSNNFDKHDDVKALTVFSPTGRIVIGIGEKFPSHLQFWHDLRRNKQYNVTYYDNKNDLILIKALFKLNSNSDALRLATNSVHKKNPIGWLLVNIHTEYMYHRLAQNIIELILAAVIAICISLFFGLRASKKISRPIMETTDVVSEITNGNYKKRVSEDCYGELAILKDGINNMANTIENANHIMEEHITQATHDLTRALDEMEAQNRELKTAKIQGLESTREKSAFLTHISHELRSPLININNIIKLVSEGKLSTTQQERITTVRQAVINLVEMTNDILDLSSIQSVDFALHMHPVTLSTLIEETLLLHAPSAKQKNLSLAMYCANDVPQQIYADGLRLKQILGNLISNAIKFTVSGEINVSVSLENHSSKDNNCHLKFNVEDTGSGISKDEQVKITSYLKDPNASLTKDAATGGLGLLISNKLIKSMQGKLGIDSAPGKGSNFWFTIKTQTVSDSGTLPYPDLSQYKILLFDDHRTSRKHLMQTLSRCNSRFTVAYDKILFNNILQEDKNFHLVILSESNLSSVTEFMTYLNSIRGNTKAKIMLLANKSMEELTIYSKDCDISHYLCKPCTNEKFIQTMLQALGIDTQTSGISTNIPSTKNKYANCEILLVSSNASHTRLMQLLLKQIGIKLLISNNMEEAIVTVSNTPIDLVFVDTTSITINDDASGTLRESAKPHDKNMNIISITQDNSTSAKNQAFDNGMDDILSKPISALQILGLLKKWYLPSNTSGNNLIDDSDNTIILDFELTKKLTNHNVKTAKDILSMLHKSLLEDLPKIKLYFKRKDMQSLKSIAHKIHATSCYTGTPYLKHITKQLEDAININDTTNIKALFKTLCQVVVDTIKEIKKVTKL
ncbi:MAG: hypothetical protein COB50_00695 [Thiotrichales bacterium]|nr:MAG: hypothetical protein COB50_00695 [Thiotrichales bacterium]